MWRWHKRVGSRRWFWLMGRFSYVSTMQRRCLYFTRVHTCPGEHWTLSNGAVRWLTVRGADCWPVPAKRATVSDRGEQTPNCCVLVCCTFPNLKNSHPSSINIFSEDERFYHRLDYTIITMILCSPPSRGQFFWVFFLFSDWFVLRDVRDVGFHFFSWGSGIFPCDRRPLQQYNSSSIYIFSCNKYLNTHKQKQTKTLCRQSVLCYGLTNGRQETFRVCGGSLHYRYRVVPCSLEGTRPPSFVWLLFEEERATHPPTKCEMKVRTVPEENFEFDSFLFCFRAKKINEVRCCSIKQAFRRKIVHEKLLIII